MDDTATLPVEDFLTPPVLSERSMSQDLEDGWTPKLNPTQQKIFHETAMYTLAFGERASGKTIGALHKLVRHCYDNGNALAIIIVGVKRQAEEGGAWDKLLRAVLPLWAAGLGYAEGFYDERKNPYALFTAPKTNTAKDIFIWIRNMHGGFSRVLLLSMPVEGFVADRVKGMEPSFVLVDEAQTLETDTYFSAVVQQIGRPRNPEIEFQQIIYCCNPAGKRHWLYKRFWDIGVNAETGEMMPQYARYHVPIQENRHNISDAYWNNVMEAVKGDEVEEARMLRGEWIDRPSGVAIFKPWLRPLYHFRGDAIRNQGLMPHLGSEKMRWPIFIGYDPGPANFSVHFLQFVQTSERPLWLVFDELNFVGQYMPTQKVVPLVLERMEFWNAWAKAKGMAGDFLYVHVGDEAAFSQKKADGSFEAKDIQDFSRASATEPPRIRMRACPKGKNSQPYRVRMMCTLLGQDSILVSELCPKTKEMLLNLESEKPKKDEYDPNEGLRPKASPYRHSFDSLTYPMVYASALSRFVARTEDAGAPQVFSCGQR